MYVYALLQPLPYRGFKFVQYLSMYTFDIIMNNNKERDIGFTLIVDGDYYLKPLHRDLQFLHEKRLVDRIIKLAFTFYDQKTYVCQIALSKENLKHRQKRHMLL